MQWTETPTDAARRGLFEIDRTLDVLAFSDFGRCRYLPVGFVVSPQSAQGIAFTETYPPLPLLPSFTPRVMKELDLMLARGFVRHSEHILAVDEANYTEAMRALATALRWCRLGSLARGFSESVTVAFVMEWMALESLLLTSPKERVTDALRRLPTLMRHWPLSVSSDYMPGLRSADPESERPKWRTVIDDLYRERKEMFHGREFHVPANPDAPQSWERGAKTFSYLEAILGRCVAFVGKRSRTYATVADVWSGVDSYIAERDDTPPSNLGGWGRSWDIVKE